MDSNNNWAAQFAKLRNGVKSNTEKEAVVEEKPIVVPEPTIIPDPDDDLSDQELPQESIPTPIKETNPLSVDALEQLAQQQKKCEEMMEGWKNKISQLRSLCVDYQLPKGMQSMVRNLNSVLNVVVATRALAEYYLKTVTDQSSSLIKESKLDKAAGKLSRWLENNDQKMQERLDELETMINNNEDRPVLNTRSRLLKEQLASLVKISEKQAKTFSTAIFSHPSEKGFLTILERFANDHDERVMTSVDNTLYLAGTGMVLVEDVPAMIKALDNNDTDGIADLQKKLIDHFY